MPTLRKSSKPTKDVPAHTRGVEQTPVSGYTAKNPSYFKRKTINMSNRPAKVYQDEQGRTVVDLPPVLYNQVVDGVKDPEIAFQESGVESWEYTSGEVLIGSTDVNRRKKARIPIEIPHRNEVI